MRANEDLETYPFKFPSFSIPYLRELRELEDIWFAEVMDQIVKSDCGK